MEIVFDINSIKSENFTSNQKIEMFDRMLSCSKKLQDHILNCGHRESCLVEKKFSFFLHCFLTFEKKENKKIDVSQIMVEEMVDDCIFSDKSCKFI